MPDVKATLKKKINGYLYDVNLKTSADNVYVNQNNTLADTLDNIYSKLIVNVDDSLSVTGDAADAAVCGNLFDLHNKDISNLKGMLTQTKNLFNKNKIRQNSVISDNGKYTFSQIATNITTEFIPLIENNHKISILNILIPNYNDGKIINTIHAYSDNVEGLQEDIYIGKLELIDSNNVIHINGSLYNLYTVEIPDTVKYVIVELSLIAGSASSILNNILICDSNEYTGRLYSYGTKCVKNDYIDLEQLNDLVYKNNNISIHDSDDKTILKINEKNGIRILNNNYPNATNNDLKIMIGTNNNTGVSNETNDIVNGIQLETNGGVGSFSVKTGSGELIHLSNKSGPNDIIKGNSNLEIVAGGYTSSISFRDSNAGLTFTNSTWTERLKQLEINTSKGVVIESNDNSYFKSGDKKLVLGNNFNQVEFRTDGIAKFKSVINAKDYQINGTAITDTIQTIGENIAEDYKAIKTITNDQIGHINSEEFDWKLNSKYNNLNLFYDLNLHLIPNRTYKFDNTDSKSTVNYISKLRLDFNAKYSQSDVFVIDVELSSLYYDNGVDTPLYVTPTIILPFGVTWKNNQAPKLTSASSTNNFVTNHIEITICNNIASYKSLTENNKVFNVLYPEYKFSYDDKKYDVSNNGYIEVDGNIIMSDTNISDKNGMTIINGSYIKFSYDDKNINDRIIKFIDCNEKTYIVLKNIEWAENHQSLVIDDNMIISEDYNLHGSGVYDIYVCGTTVYCVTVS